MCLEFCLICWDSREFTVVDSLRAFAPRSSGRAVKDASLFDSGRSNIHAERKSVDVCIVHDLKFFCRAFLVGKFAVLLKFAVHFGFAPW